jgi:hypothetical protein
MKEKFSAAGANELQNSENEKGTIAGFWRGLWHGLIAPFAFLISLFKENIGVYETHNNGKRYNLGFIMGLMIIFGGNSDAGQKISRQKNE